MNKLARYIVAVLLLIGWTSCSTIRAKPKCGLLPLSNTIYGGEAEAKEFGPAIDIGLKKGYLPYLVEKLLSAGKPEIIAIEFSKAATVKHVSYEISGCADTTWAKQTMAKHLMKKYHMLRYDSVYQDTILKLTVVDESKLPIDTSRINTNEAGWYYMPGEVSYKTYKRQTWNARLFLPPDLGMRREKNYTVEAESRAGRYTFVVYKDIYSEGGLTAFSDDLQERYGITLTLDRIETVSAGVYLYSK